MLPVPTDPYELSIPHTSRSTNTCASRWLLVLAQDCSPLISLLSPSTSSEPPRHLLLDASLRLTWKSELLTANRLSHQCARSPLASQYATSPVNSFHEHKPTAMSRTRQPKGAAANAMPRKNPLASLKMADMVISKPHLPLGRCVS